tara:strand:+ start:1038 stop:2600 length:1563 start_codon:yes stop_codon:yes gene_type:complete
MDVVEINPDILDIGEINIPHFKLSNDSDNDADIDEMISTKPSVNFGSGIELLMNEKSKNEKKASTNIEIDDITRLEDELNDLTDLTNNINTDKSVNLAGGGGGGGGSNKKTIFGSLFNDDKRDGANVKPVTENLDSQHPNLGKSTSDLNEDKTWDGFGKFNNVPVNLEKTQKEPELTKEEELREKFKYLRKLEELEKKGASLTQRYNMDSNLQEMMGEYEMIIAEKERSNSVKFQGKMMMACITGLEFLNNKFDPFDVKLDGWGEQINENIDEYDDIFAELHEKYKSKAKMSPELKLLFQLGGSAMMVHMSNTLFKSSMPGMDDIMKQNPELMKQFTQAAVNTMGQSNPGFGGFMNNIFNDGKGGGNSGGNSGNRGNGRGPNTVFGQNVNMEMPPNANMGPPPSPMETKLPERSQRTSNIPNRPDLMSARSGVSIDENEGHSNNEPRITRPEMRGPTSKQTDINSLLSGLKTKQINVNEARENNELSTISIEDLKELTGAKIAKSKRKQKSDKNIVSLDI